MSQPRPSPDNRLLGVRLIGTGAALPDRVLTNQDLEKLMDTSDEWIVQRTGIRSRHVCDFDKGEGSSVLGALALGRALDAAGLAPADLDLIVCATMTAEMPCPPCASRIACRIGAPRCGAFDVNGACSGFVFALNMAHELCRTGAYKTIGLVGADTLTKFMDYSNAGRGTSILFGDGAGAVILRATDDASKGIIAQFIHGDADGWREIYIPNRPTDCPAGFTCSPDQLGRVIMNGSGVFKFAVTTFPRLIQETLDKAGLRADDVDMYVCHQSNARILTASRERFHLSHERLHINIDRVGNTVAASVPMCFDELVRSGRIREGMKIMFLGFGGGLTWGSSLWQL